MNPPAPDPPSALVRAVGDLPKTHGLVDRATLEGMAPLGVVAMCAREAHVLACALIYALERETDDAKGREGRQAVLERLGQDLHRLSLTLAAAAADLGAPPVTTSTSHAEP